MPNPDPQYSERNRDQILSEIHAHIQALSKLSSGLVRAPLPELGEHLAGLDEQATSFLTKLRLLAP
jgi:hypothetical protein